MSHVCRDTDAYEYSAGLDEKKREAYAHPTHLRCDLRRLERDRPRILPDVPCPPHRRHAQLEVIHLERLHDHQRKVGQGHRHIPSLGLGHRGVAQLGQRCRPRRRLRLRRHVLPLPTEGRPRGGPTPRRLHVRAHRVKQAHALLLPVEPLSLQRLEHHPAFPSAFPSALSIPLPLSLSLSRLRHDPSPLLHPPLRPRPRGPEHRLDPIARTQLRNLGRAHVGRGNEERESGVSARGEEGAVDVGADVGGVGGVDGGELHDYKGGGGG